MGARACLCAGDWRGGGARECLDRLSSPLEIREARKRRQPFPAQIDYCIASNRQLIQCARCGRDLLQVTSLEDEVLQFVRQLRVWGRAWGIPDLGKIVSVARNPRLRTTIARYVLRTRTIELGTAFFHLRKHRMAVLCHEAAHAAVTLRYGTNSRPHGAVWASLVQAVGYAPQRIRKVRVRDNDPIQPPARQTASRPRYEHRCPVCHFRYLAHRPVRTWRCPECAGIGLSQGLTVKPKDLSKDIG